MSVKRGDIYYADLSPVVGSEQGGLRPVLIIQNDVGNRYSPTVIAAAITSRMGKTRLPTHIDIYAERAGLAKDSVILLEQIRTLDKRRLKEKMGHLDEGMIRAGRYPCRRGKNTCRTRRCYTSKLSRCVSIGYS